MQQKKRIWTGNRGLTVLLSACTLLSIACTADRNEKISSIYELKADPNEANLQRIRELVDDPDRDVRATALNALVTLRTDDAEQVARLGLEDEDGFVRATAAKLLGDLGLEQDAAALGRRLVEDPDPVVRRRAADALTTIGGAEAVAALAEALADPIEDVRLAVVRGLRDLDPGFAAADLSRLVLEDPSYQIRVQACGALGATGDPELLPILERALEDPNEFVRAAAANALRVHKSAREREATGT